MQHGGVFGARFFVAVDVAFVERTFEAGRIAQRLLELELQNERQEVARVRRVAGDVVLGARIEVFLRARDRRGDALIVFTQLPPAGIVLIRLNLAGEDFPAPLIDKLAPGQEHDLIQRPLHLRIDHGFRVRLLRRHEADLVQMRGRERQRHRIADRFVESVVRRALEHRRQVFVVQVVVDVAEFVVDRGQLILRRLDALFNAHVALCGIQVPGAGVTDDVAVARAGEHRALPERLRQFLHAERDVEVLSDLGHLHRHSGVGLMFEVGDLQRGRRLVRLAQFVAQCVALLFQCSGDVEAGHAFVGFDQGIDVAPLLGPHVTEQVRGDLSGLRNDGVAVLGVQLGADVAMQFVVERLHLGP